MDNLTNAWIRRIQKKKFRLDFRLDKSMKKLASEWVDNSREYHGIFEKGL